MESLLNYIRGQSIKLNKIKDYYTNLKFLNGEKSYKLQGNRI